MAVDGLPELFENDTLFTDDDKNVITAGGTVEFKLSVEKLDSAYSADLNTITFESSLFSTYAIAYTEKSGGGGGGGSHDSDNYDFWERVQDKIENAEDGDTVKASAGNYDKVPESGGVWEVNAPDTAAQTPMTATPGDKGTSATREQAQTQRAAISPHDEPSAITPPDTFAGTEDAEAAASGNVGLWLGVLVAMLVALAVGRLWLRRKKQGKRRINRTL